MAVDEQKAAVRRFWEEKPCGSTHSLAPEGTPEYFDQVERRRRELEPFIDRFADFGSTRGQEVLEVGTGLGTDFVRFARAGARVTGIDLTEHSVRLVRRRLELEGLEGDVRVADAEHLPFSDRSFDVVYSWGVLHHTPDPTRAISEVLRVVKSGGRVCAMLYARRSWVAYALWVRHAALRGRPHRSLDSVLAEHMESTGTRGFSKRELRTLFAKLEDLTVDQISTPYDRRVAGPAARLTSRYLGWFLVVRGRAG
jgi:ubiquinone/menaquinone biosynthesis C-methylase UbiE